MNDPIQSNKNYCALCNKPASHCHHLVFGTSGRRLSDEDNLVLFLCAECHRQIHEKPLLPVCSKIIGQLAYERNKCAEGYGVDAARQSFMRRYGKGYL